MTEELGDIQISKRRNTFQLKGALSHQNVATLVDFLSNEELDDALTIKFEMQSLEVSDSLALVVITNLFCALSKRVDHIKLQNPPSSLLERLLAEDLVGTGKKISYKSLELVEED